jgi:hypothetical protein
MKRSRFFPWLILPAALLAIAGCGGTTTVVVTSKTPPPTTTPTVPPVPTVDPALISLCFGPGVDPATVGEVDKVLFLAAIGPLGYPTVRLPPGTPEKPYKLSGTPDNNFTGSFVSGVSVDPFGKSAPYKSSLYLQLCNTSSVSTYTLQGISVKLASFTPLTGTVDAWTPTPCDTTYYQNAPAKVIEEGGCGGAFVDDLSATATFSSATSGTVVTATPTGSHGSLPMADVTGPLTADIALTLPATAGTYAFAIGVQLDGITSSFASSGAGDLYAPISVLWSGQACADPTMSSKIPASPVANYICPIP